MVEWRNYHASYKAKPGFMLKWRLRRAFRRMLRLKKKVDEDNARIEDVLRGQYWPK
jgi:hypothetical protein